MLRVLTMIAALFGSACSDQNPVSPNLDEAFPLGFGEERSIDGGTLKLRFVALSEDSRCPTGVQCVQAGQATIVIKAERDGDAAAEFELTIPAPDSAEYRDYRVQLLALDPYPDANRTTNTADYEATLIVSPVTD